MSVFDLPDDSRDFLQSELEDDKLSDYCDECGNDPCECEPEEE